MKKSQKEEPKSSKDRTRRHRLRKCESSRTNEDRRQEGLKKQRSGQVDDDVRWREAGGYDAGWLRAENRFCSRYGLTGTKSGVFAGKVVLSLAGTLGNWGMSETFTSTSMQRPPRTRHSTRPTAACALGPAWASEEFGGLGVFQNNSPPNKRVQSSISPAVVLTTFRLGIQSRAWTSRIAPSRREIPPKLHFPAEIGREVMPELVLFL